MSSPFPPPDPDSQSGYLKIRNEIMVGGTDDVAGAEPVGGRRAAIGLGMIALLLVVLAWWSLWAFVFVVLLIGCIFLHEVGHFATARWTGMKATQFFLFMGPKLWSFRRGETEYGVRAYPIGAYVRIIGMNNLDEVDPADEPRAYRNQTYPRRMLVICAGSMMHILIAIALMFGVYATKGALGPTGEVVISTVVAGGPADNAGIRPDDVVVSIDGQTVSSADEFVAVIRSHEPQDIIPLVVERDGQEVAVTAGLGSNTNPGEFYGSAFLGVSSADVQDWVGMPVGEAAVRSITDLGTQAWQSGVEPGEHLAARVGPEHRPCVAAHHRGGRQPVQRSGGLRDRSRWHLADAGRRERVRGSVQPVPDAALRRRSCGHRHLRTAAHPQGPAGLSRRRVEDDPGGHDDDGAVGLLAARRAVPRHRPSARRVAVAH
jgi:hypothetical protein